MEKTYKPIVAGILAIVAGAGGVIAGFFLLVGIAAFNLFGRSGGVHIPLGVPNSIMMIITVLAIPFFALAVLAVVGGAFALQRRNWGLALAGSIAALIISFVLGATSIVFTVLSKNEFK
jgi:hypothetical protein